MSANRLARVWLALPGLASLNAQIRARETKLAPQDTGHSPPTDKRDNVFVFAFLSCSFLAFGYFTSARMGSLPEMLWSFALANAIIYASLSSQRLAFSTL